VWGIKVKAFDAAFCIDVVVIIVNKKGGNG
jgi:hypothetical protein